MKNKIVIIGGGPGGYVAVIRLQQLGFTPIVIEKERLGGVCLNRGCIPTKALLKTAEVFFHMQHAKEYGLRVAQAEYDLDAINKRKSGIVEKLVRGVEHLFAKRKIETIIGTAQKIEKQEDGFAVHILQNGQLEIVETEKIILATGSSAIPFPNVPFDEKVILSSDGALALNRIPERIAIIGGGVIGCEFACIFNALGSQVEMIEMLPQLLPTEEPDIAKRMAMALKKRKVKLHLKTRVQSIETHEDGAIVHLEKGKLEVDQVLVSIGRRPNIAGLRLEEIGIETNKQGIVIDEHMRTNVPGIFAIGDVTGKLMLAHTASAQGLHVAEFLHNERQQKPAPTSALTYENIPRCVYTFPEEASVGLTENQAKERNIAYKTGSFPFAANGKALAMGETDGFVKVIVDEKSILIGAHILGPNATELIAELALAVQNRMPLNQLILSVHSHPTLSEAIAEAAEDIENLAIHKL